MLLYNPRTSSNAELMGYLLSLVADMQFVVKMLRVVKLRSFEGFFFKPMVVGYNGVKLTLICSLLVCAVHVTWDKNVTRCVLNFNSLK